jgi:hypothetical protein
MLLGFIAVVGSAFEIARGQGEWSISNFDVQIQIGGDGM